MQAGVLVSSHSITLIKEKPVEVDGSVKFNLEFDKDRSSQFIKLNAFECISWKRKQCNFTVSWGGSDWYKDWSEEERRKLKTVQ